MRNVEGSKRKRKLRTVILVLVGVIVVALIGGFLASEPGRREVRELVIADINFESLRDGSYVGEYTGAKDSFRDTQVEVSINAGKISDIKILKGALDKEGRPAELTGGKSIDDLFDNVVRLQTLQVDVISGATLTSKAHLKALENALKQAQKN